MELIFDEIKKNIRDGFSPSQLLKDIFEYIDNTINTGEKKAVLYCSCFGGFNYSDEFHLFINETLNIDTFDSISKHRETYPYIEAFAKHLNVSIETALQRASGECCELAIKWVPCHRRYCINEYDGAESVEVLLQFNL